MASDRVKVDATISCASGDHTELGIERVHNAQRGWELAVRTTEGKPVLVSMDDLAEVVAALGEVMP